MNDIHVINFGCRLNIAEGDAVWQAAVDAGLSATVIINSCAVTAEAERQLRQAIRRRARQQPDVPIYVTGCAANISTAKLAAMPDVARLIPNQHKTVAQAYRDITDNQDYSNSPSLSNSLPLTDSPMSHIRLNNPNNQGSTTTAPPPPSFAPLISSNGYSRAFIAVQNGCDHSCTFCIIPQGRGKNRSASIADCVRVVKQAVARGHKEIVLSGVDLTGYGQDLPTRPKLGQLVAQILRDVPDLPRVRLSSLDASEIDPMLFELLTEEARLMPHVHLSLQSGDDMILKRMKRRHCCRDAIDLVERLKIARPTIAIGADIIAGFPTESEEMYTNSLRLIDACDIVFGHIFPYSPRAGTAAARMPQVERNIARARAEHLRAACATRLAALHHRMIGSVETMLVEGDGLHGYAENYTRLTLDTPRPAGLLQRVILRGLAQAVPIREST